MEYLLWYLSLGLAAAGGFPLCSMLTWGRHEQRNLRRMMTLRQSIEEMQAEAERHANHAEMARWN